jgi:anti-sigma factor RsiW
VTCRELTDFLADYLGDELAEPLRAAFDKHLAACPDCRRYLDSYRKTIQLSQTALGPSTESAEVPEALVAAILKAKRQGC